MSIIASCAVASTLDLGEIDFIITFHYMTSG